MRCKALKPTSDSRLQDFLGTLQSFEAYTPKISGQGYFIFPEIPGVHVNLPVNSTETRISTRPSSHATDRDPYWPESIPKGQTGGKSQGSFVESDSSHGRFNNDSTTD